MTDEPTTDTTTTPARKRISGAQKRRDAWNRPRTLINGVWRLNIWQPHEKVLRGRPKKGAISPPQPIYVQWSDEDAAYIATRPDWPGLSGIGNTTGEAVAELRVAIRLAEQATRPERVD